MNIVIHSVLFLLFFHPTNFGKTSIEVENLIGFWETSNYNDSYIVYSKIDNFRNDGAGIQFLKDGKLLKRQNSGWCGTPPISYSNFEGTWELKDGNKVSINYKYWGGEIQETWEINYLEKNSMKIRVLDYKTSNNN
jgi:hypothetical protein